MPEPTSVAPTAVRLTLARRLWCASLSWLLRVRNRHLFVWDVVSQPAIAFLAFFLRLDLRFPAGYGQAMVLYALLAPCLKVPIFYLSDMYRRFWRYATAGEVRRILVTAVAASAVHALAVFIVLVPLGLMGPVPRSIPFLDAMLTVGALALPRLAMRLANRSWLATGRAAPEATHPVLIVGAGEAGCMVVDQLCRNPQLGLKPVGFLDDDRHKQGLKVSDVPVLGPTDALPDLVPAHRVERVIIAIPSADGRTIRRLVNLCRRAGVETFILPGVSDLLSGKVSVQRLREVRVEDLLRREPVRIDHTRVAELLKGRRVLVTGGGGSIGGELCRQIASYHPAELVVLGRGENSLYHIGAELKRDHPALAMHLVVADVRDGPRLRGIFCRHRPEIIFHAAAHKHVPLMEANVEDAVTNNVLGTRTLLDVALAFDVPRLVMISTDKVVHPTSVMGATKRLAEMLVQDVAYRGGRAYVIVRFGNVLGSRGSVVPLFQAQIAAGGPVTVTHPDARRYFMTISEAVQLVLEAAVMGQGGEVFVLDMGQPVRIVDLARDMIELSGYQVGRDIGIEFVGLRPGEKLFEELFLDSESYERSAHEKIFICRNGCTFDENASHELYCCINDLVNAAREGDLERIQMLMRQLIPDYTPQDMAKTSTSKPERSG